MIAVSRRRRVSNSIRRGTLVSFLDFASLAASLAVRIRAAGSRVVMHRASLLRSLSAADAIEQAWQADLARQARRATEQSPAAVLHEMLSADVLLRTWSAFVASSVDSGWHPLRTQNSAAILTHMQLRQRKRLLSTIIHSAMDSDDLLILDRYRRATERWTDVLLSVFPATATTRALQFDNESCGDFQLMWPASDICASRATDPVVVTALKSALPAMELTVASRREAYAELAASITTAIQHDRRARERVSTLAP